ncbi:hypothetical protein D3C72_2139160 [compost metagenome]
MSLLDGKAGACVRQDLGQAFQLTVKRPGFGAELRKFLLVRGNLPAQGGLLAGTCVGIAAEHRTHAGALLLEQAQARHQQRLLAREHVAA